MVTIVLPLAFSLLLQAGSSNDPLLDLSKNVVGIVRSALDSGCVKTRMIGAPIAGASIPAKIWRIGAAKISRIEPSEPWWRPEVICTG